MTRKLRIGIIGGGAWGTALAQVAVRAGHAACLWVREPDVIVDINERHSNLRFLPGVPLDAALRATGELADLGGSDAILLVTPAQHARALSMRFAAYLEPGTPVAICAKGLEQGTDKLLSEVLAEACPRAVPAVLSGPSFAADVARGLPTAVTLACADARAAAKLVAALGLPTFRPYLSDDVIGAQIGGAVKNVLAIACGIVEGRGLGDSARAALIARGFAEMTRLGLRLGGRMETLAGLSGLGDLVLTATSPQSRNYSLGLELGAGRALADILAARAGVTEGVTTAGAVADLGARLKIDLPISSAVAGVVSGALGLDAAIEGLLARPFRGEGE